MHIDHEVFDEVYFIFDQNENQKVDVGEFIGVLNSAKHHDEQAGSLLITELARYVKENQLTIKALFNQFDKNKDGYLSKQELKGNKTPPIFSLAFMSKNTVRIAKRISDQSDFVTFKKK